MSTSESMNKTALVMGATGATGKALLRDLLISSSYAKIVAVGRRQAKVQDGVPQDKLEQKVVDFENLEAHRDVFRGVNDVYCCLGTTRADAGSAEAFKRIDQSYVVNSAKIIAQENPATTGLSPVHFLYVSATNANKNSPFLYPKTKGETEEQLASAGFQRVSIMRPGALEVEEPRERPRLLEKIFVDYLMVPANRMFNLHMAVSVSRVAKAMQKVAENAEPVTDPTKTKVDIYSNKDIEDLTA